MGITLVQKSDFKNVTKNPKISLVLAGGAITGGAFKIGGLKALNDFLLNKKLTDFDIYVGISAGAILAVPFAGGISPEEMLKSLDGTSKDFSQLSPFEFYRPNLGEFIKRPLKYMYGNLTFLPGVLYDVLTSLPKLREVFFETAFEFLKHPTYSNYEHMMKPFLKVAFSTRRIPSITEMAPSGLFDNRSIETYLRRNMQKNRMPNSFRVLKRATGKSLYMMAMDLDTSERVVFGPDEKNDIRISQAAQASSALPGFYKPARINGVDYVDGSVRKTAHVNLAFQKGADLVVCYNPFRPYSNKIMLEYMREEKKHITKDKRIVDWGLPTIINQVFRTLIHSRLHMGIERLKNDPGFNKDIILIEPKEDDLDFFDMNPLYFWNRAKAAKMGFQSVLETIQENYSDVEKILNAYGIDMTTEQIEEDQELIKQSSNDDHVIMEVLEKTHPRHRRRSKKKTPGKRTRLKVVRGGK